MSDTDHIKTYLKRILWELEVMNGKEPSKAVPNFYTFDVNDGRKHEEEAYKKCVAAMKK